ncbi:CrcB family protein [soil metagenome]
MSPVRPAILAPIALGGALGSVARYLLAIGLLPVLGPGFPWATLSANAAGSFLIGLFAALASPGGRLALSPAAWHFVTTGFCGGFTTFSIFSLEAVLLVEAGAPGRAALYVAVSLMAWLLAVALGWRAGDRLNRLARPS